MPWRHERPEVTAKADVIFDSQMIFEKTKLVAIRCRLQIMQQDVSTTRCMLCKFAGGDVKAHPSQQRLLVK